MTKEKMKKWSSYYRKAIIENAPDVEAARNAVWAIFFHSLSTLEDPHHSFCSESWCFWKQAEKEGVDPKRKYAETRHDVPLPRDISERLIPLFQRLSNHELLCRCKKLQTSNANESLHATVWRRAPKSKYCGKKTAEMAVALAVMQYNKGATALVDAVDSLGVSPGSEVVRVASRINVVRVRKADHATRQASKTSRKRKALEKLQLGVHPEATEGNLYESGAHSTVRGTVSVLSPVTVTCIHYNFFSPYKYLIWFTPFIIYLTHVPAMKNSHNADFTLVLLKIFDVHLVFRRFLKTYFSTILLFCGRSPDVFPMVQ